jgi:glucan-binding YG repeat protein
MKVYMLGSTQKALLRLALCSLIFSWGAVVATSTSAFADDGESYEEELSEDELEQLLADEEVVEVTDDSAEVADEGDEEDDEDEEIVEVTTDDSGAVEVKTPEVEIKTDGAGAVEVKTAEAEVKTDEAGEVEVKTAEAEVKATEEGTTEVKTGETEVKTAVATTPQATPKAKAKRKVKRKAKRRVAKKLFVLLISSATSGKLVVDGKGRGQLNANKKRAIPMKPGMHTVQFVSAGKTRTFKVRAKAGARKSIRISGKGKVAKGRTKARKGKKGKGAKGRKGRKGSK